MKNLITLLNVFFLLFIVSFLSAQDSDAVSWIFIEKGTPIFVRSHIDLSAKNLKKDQQICLYVSNPLSTENGDIIPSGTPAYFKISKIRKPKMAGEAGYMEVVPQYLKLSNGTYISMEATPFVVVGQDKTEEAFLVGDAVGASSTIFYTSQADYEKNLARTSNNLGTQLSPSGTNLNNVGQAVEILAPLAGLLVKGGHAIIPKGQVLQIFVEKDTPIEVGF